MRKRKWDEAQLRSAVINSTSFRQVIQKLGLRPAGGNYEQIKKFIQYYRITTGHFKGMGWSKGLKGIGKPRFSLKQILTKDSHFQSFKLKKRLFTANLKEPRCEICGWAQKTKDGYLPLELDHVNGDHHDNRIRNLRILCPNCHSLQPTHRGRNQKRHH